MKESEERQKTKIKQPESMFDDLNAYFYENVVASFEEYISTKKSNKSGRSRDLRIAVNAASALFHLREHLPDSNQLSEKEIELLCPDYKIIGNITNASKHKVIDRKKPLISKASQLKEVTFITTYTDEQGDYRFIEKEVTAELEDGSKRLVSELLTNVMNFWQSYLHSIGVIKKPHSYQLNSKMLPIPREQAGNGQLDIEIIREVRYTNAMCFQKYNYEKGIIEPTDLTGCTITGGIYKPNYEIALSLTKNATGETLSTTVFLNEEKSQEVLRLQTEADKQAFVNSLPEVQEALRKMAEELRLTA